MTDIPENSKSPKRKGFLTAGLFAAAVGIAVAVYVSNGSGPQAQECSVSAQLTQNVDAAAQGELAALLAASSGRGYADMGFLTPDGQPTSIADFAGKNLLVNFWATWCGPCREEMPALDDLAAAYNSDQFEVLTINLDLGDDGQALAADFMVDNELEHLPLYLDPSFSTFERLKAQGVSLGLPTTLLLDESGCEVAVLQGPAEWFSQNGKDVIEALIAG